MKKRIMATVMALALSVSLLAGCGGTSEKDYLKDAKEIVEAAEGMENLSSDPKDGVKELKAIVKSMKVRTPEGKQLKADLKKMSNAASKLSKNDNDEDAMKDFLEASKDFVDHMVKFMEAAEEAGVDQKDLADLF